MVPQRYLKTLFRNVQWSFPGFDIYLLKNPTAWAMFVLVHTISYIKLPTTLAYGTREISSSSSSLFLGQWSTYKFTPTGIGTLIVLLYCMLNLCSIISTCFLWFKLVILLARSLLISIPIMKFATPRSFISNLEDSWDFNSFITSL